MPVWWYSHSDMLLFLTTCPFLATHMCLSSHTPICPFQFAIFSLLGFRKLDYKPDSDLEWRPKVRGILRKLFWQHTYINNPSGACSKSDPQVKRKLLVHESMHRSSKVSIYVTQGVQVVLLLHHSSITLHPNYMWFWGNTNFF